MIARQNLRVKQERPFIPWFCVLVLGFGCCWVSFILPSSSFECIPIPYSPFLVSHVLFNRRRIAQLLIFALFVPRIGENTLKKQSVNIAASVSSCVILSNHPLLSAHWSAYIFSDLRLPSSLEIHQPARKFSQRNPPSIL